MAAAAWWNLRRADPPAKPSSGRIAKNGAPGVPPHRQSASSSRPNVLLISLDTVRADHLGCLGYQKPITPNLDRFAQRSVLFSNCRSQAPWTLPSHMSLLTSMLPSHNGVDNLNKVLTADVATLTEILQQEGYRTAALVNNGQMKAHWGFARGFDMWREFEVDTPESNCESITVAALDWLRARQTDKPFFLFLHYYDAHDPYEAPEAYRQLVGARLSGEQSRAICTAHRTPERNLADPRLKDVIAAYDAELAWLDHELGRLLAHVPPDTVIVIFSDHGEAFEEHGWMLHGATLYEEEIHVPLIVRLPEGHKGRIVNEPVMLLDVAPTVLALCGVQPPLQFQGTDLEPLWQGRPLRRRLIPSEAKAVLEGRLTLSVVLYPLKATYSLFDGQFELYKLPDEQTNLAERERAATDAMFKPLREWIQSEQFWMVHAAGSGDFEATLRSPEPFSLFIPVGLEQDRDNFEVADEGRTIRWHVYPRSADRPKSLFLQTSRPDAPLQADFAINGQHSTKMVFLGKDRQHPSQLPVSIPPSIPPVDPLIQKPLATDKPGFYVFRHQSSAGGQTAKPGKVESLDEQTIRQLKSLGYLQ